MHDLDDAGGGQHARQRRQIGERERIDAHGVVRRRQLHEAQLRAIGALAQELGVQANARLRGKMRGERGKVRRCADDALQTGSDDDLYNRACPLCEARAGTERHHEGAHTALCADRVAAPGPAGPAGLDAAARADRPRLSGRESCGEQRAAAGQGLGRAGAGRHAVHAGVVRRPAEAPGAVRAHPADRDRGIRTAGAAVAAADPFRLAHAALRRGCAVAGAGRLRGAAADHLAGRRQQPDREGGAGMVEPGERRAGDPADLHRAAAAVRSVPPRQGLKSAPMHIHILGICGTFMGGVAALARAAGFSVSGSDRNVYPPMSTQLQALGIAVTEGFDAAQLTPAPDVVLVGNVMTRGQPVIEALLELGLPYASGPEWLAREVLKGRWVLAIAGTHGKTTTASLLAWILEHAGRNPGFLIGGVPTNFGVSARLGARPYFVIEADEYDTAFFDKRAKFVHYHPRTLTLNNLEYDHADI